MQNFSLQGNWIDLIILVVLILFLSEAFRVGFWIIIADFLSFLASLVIALRGYQWTALFLRSNFSLSHSLSNALGFLLTATISEWILSYLLSLLIRKIPSKFWKTPWNKILAIPPALGEGLILTAFVLTLILGLPLSPNVKSGVVDSKIGGFLVEKTTGLEAKLNDIFGGVIEDSLTYLTVEPRSQESIPLNVGKATLSVDEASETQMFKLVNEERTKVGIVELKWTPELVAVAEAHAKDMWIRHYFGHISPDGEDVGVRLDKAGIVYTLAGENLALAPTVTTAHNGLMNSEGHRANILEPGFKKVGIGVIDNGVYGKMFVQVYTD